MNNFLDFNNKVKEKVIHQRNNYMKKDGKLYTLDGEYISDLYTEIVPNYISENQLEQFKSKQVLGEHEKENGGFIFMFYKSLQNFDEIIPDLSNTDIARLLYLATYVSYEENKIQFDNGLEINDRSLMELLRLNRNSYKKFLDKLTANRILFIDEGGSKSLSPSFCKYGTIDAKKLRKYEIGYIRLFKGTVRELFNQTPIRELGRLATIYMILPYLNLATNIVSHNPDEEDSEKVKPMTITELANLLGYSNHTKFRQTLYDIKINGETAFAFVLLNNDKRSMRMIVNPDIVFAGSAEQLKAIKAIFNNA